MSEGLVTGEDSLLSEERWEEAWAEYCRSMGAAGPTPAVEVTAANGVRGFVTFEEWVRIQKAVWGVVRGPLMEKVAEFIEGWGFHTGGPVYLARPIAVGENGAELVIYPGQEFRKAHPPSVSGSITVPFDQSAYPAMDSYHESRWRWWEALSQEDKERLGAQARDYLANDHGDQ